MVAITDTCAVQAAHGRWRAGWLRRWWAARQARALCRASLADLPEELRRDVGVDGALGLAHHHNGGRVFVSYGRPDSTLNGWHW